MEAIAGARRHIEERTVEVADFANSVPFRDGETACTSPPVVAKRTPSALAAVDRGSAQAPSTKSQTTRTIEDVVRGLRSRLMQTVTGHHSIALFDQAAVSATSFLTTILVGRWCGVDELGVYSLGLSVL